MGLAAYIIYDILNFSIGIINEGYINNAISVSVAIIVGVITYVYSMVLTKGITDEELDFLPARIKKILKSKI